MEKYSGANGIWVQVLRASSAEGQPDLYTLRLHYHRFIHAEFMTHRKISRNAASSRAIPVRSMIEQVKEQPAIPIEWGKNKGGMQADSPLAQSEAAEAESLWLAARDHALTQAKMLSELKLHKQVANRILEPFAFMEVIATSSAPGWHHFLHLRHHPDAQPEINELARLIAQALEESDPQRLEPGEWHLPFVSYNQGVYRVEDETQREVSLAEAKEVSASGCAQVSFRKLDLSAEKTRKVYGMLVGSDVVHASPFEHQATPLAAGESDPAQTGNLDGWVQLRKTMQNEYFPHARA